MKKNHIELLERSKNQHKEIKGFLKSSKKSKNLDERFHNAHDNVFQKTNCLDCANCCKTTSPIFRDVDINRISRFLKVKASDFIQSYLKIDEDNDYVLKSSPCVFLNQDNTCNIYEHRPLACREYPHTNRKNMHQILDITEKNTKVCPAVAEIIFQLMR